MSFLGKVVAKVVTTGAGVVARAFAQAYREAQKERVARKAAGIASAPLKKLSKQMKIEEARAILNVEANATFADINKNFEKMFKNNDVERGGSFYLQSKVFRAKERLEDYMLHERPAAQAQAQAAAKETGEPRAPEQGQ